MRIALLGAGRMGQRHAENLRALPGAELAWVCDVDEATAAAVAKPHACRISTDPHEVLAAQDYDALIIATPTDTHIDLILAAGRAGRPILCEKPIDFDVERVAASRKQIDELGVPLQIAFNRRFDPSHRALAKAVHGGEIGALELCLITGRGPLPLPGRGYLERSGGLFFDAMIHDFDMVRFISGEEPVAIAAAGHALFLEDARALGDVDTAAVTLTLASGALCQINYSRRAVYGHDQRIEVCGERGTLISQNHREHAIERFTAEFTGAAEPYISSSRDRYRDAYRNELADFIDAVEVGRPPAVTFDDGYRALLLADAATRSLRAQATIRLC